MKIIREDYSPMVKVYEVSREDWHIVRDGMIAMDRAETRTLEKGVYSSEEWVTETLYTSEDFYDCNICIGYVTSIITGYECDTYLVIHHNFYDDWLVPMARFEAEFEGCSPASFKHDLRDFLEEDEIDKFWKLIERIANATSITPAQELEYKRKGGDMDETN